MGQRGKAGAATVLVGSGLEVERVNCSFCRALVGVYTLARLRLQWLKVIVELPKEMLRGGVS